LSIRATTTARTGAYRQRLAAKAVTTLSISVDRDTALRLRSIAREHIQSVDVLQMGSLLTHRALAGLPRNATE
jgi:hypothetical protein